MFRPRRSPSIENYKKNKKKTQELLLSRSKYLGTYCRYKWFYNKNVEILTELPLTNNDIIIIKMVSSMTI
jgi:hypothetical protein